MRGNLRFCAQAEIDEFELHTCVVAEQKVLRLEIAVSIAVLMNERNCRENVTKEIARFWFGKTVFPDDIVEKFAACTVLEQEV